MNDDLLDEFNLQPTCAKEPENNSTRVVCSNTLRFTDLNNPTKLYDGDTIDGTGIEGQVTCKLCFGIMHKVSFQEYKFNEFYIFIKLNIRHTKPDYLMDK